MTAVRAGMLMPAASVSVAVTTFSRRGRETKMCVVTPGVTREKGEMSVFNAVASTSL